VTAPQRSLERAGEDPSTRQYISLCDPQALQE